MVFFSHVAFVPNCWNAWISFVLHLDHFLLTFWMAKYFFFHNWWFRWMLDEFEWQSWNIKAQWWSSRVFFGHRWLPVLSKKKKKSVKGKNFTHFIDGGKIGAWLTAAIVPLIFFAECGNYGENKSVDFMWTWCRVIRISINIQWNGAHRSNMAHILRF